jgi:hypothetical protein
VVELSARKAYYSMRKGAFETLIHYSDRFRATHRSYTENCPTISISDNEQAMDFFHGLDSNSYGSFKANMMNGWASKAIETPDTLITIYGLAGSWVKTNTMKTEDRSAVAFLKTLDNTKSHAPKGKKNVKNPLKRQGRKLEKMTSLT